MAKSAATCTQDFDAFIKISKELYNEDVLPSVANTMRLGDWIQTGQLSKTAMLDGQSICYSLRSCSRRFYLLKRLKWHKKMPPIDLEMDFKAAEEQKRLQNSRFLDAISSDYPLASGSKNQTNTVLNAKSAKSTQKSQKRL